MKSCNQCGKCCLNYGHGGLSASEADLELWEIFRPEIFTYVANGELWFSPETGERLKRCPWLQVENTSNREVYTCAIYHDRPEDCRAYPVNLTDMVRDECEMLELRDLEDTRAAQIKLDRLMAESR